jgi:kynurenine formamidase
MRVVDLSAPITTSQPGTPDFQRNSIQYFDHASGAADIEAMFGVPRNLLRDGEGWARELLTLGTHNATHVDAPYHYNSSIGGAPAETIDELPLERFIGPGVVVDATGHADGEALTAAQMEHGIQNAGHELAPGDIVLVHSGCDRFYGQAEYLEHGPGVSAEATRWLFERGVRVMGIDAWGWDRPLRLQAAEAIARQQPGIFWEAHQVGLPYSQIERLVNLAALPPTGFQVICLPLRLARASAAPARVVALVE